MQNDSIEERTRPTAAAEEVPYVVTIERVGWRVMHQAPGKAKKATVSHFDKTEAMKLAVAGAQLVADETGTTVELHTQDRKGRPTGPRYIDPTPPAPEQGGKK